jgi:nickel-dependent lactate racemase
MVEAARTVGVDFITNVVLDNEAHISGIFSGDVVKAHEAGVAYYKEHAGVLRSERADIVVASVGHPLNRDLYQSLKAVFATAPFVADGGTIILYTSSSDGMGPALFRKWMTETDDPSTFSERIVREGFDPRIDHCYLLQRVMRSVRVCIVSERDELSSIPFITLYSDIEPALADALDRHGSDASIIAVPYATRIIPLQE